jgi:hypothetical protein
MASRWTRRPCPPTCARRTARSSDGTLQGIELTDKPAYSFQGHPEASPGPREMSYLFDRFVRSWKAAGMAPRYLYEGKARQRGQGRPRRGGIGRRGAQPPRSDGFTDVVIHDDDFLASLRAADEKQTGVARTADIEAMLRHEPCAWTMMRYVFRKAWILLAFIAAGSMCRDHAHLGVVPGSSRHARHARAGDRLPRLDHVAAETRCIAGSGPANWNGSEAIARRLRKHEGREEAAAAMLEFDSRIGACLVMKGKAAEAYALIEP